MIKVYVASKTKHAPKWKDMREVRGLKIVSTWIDDAGQGGAIDRADLAARCIQEVIEADCLIVYYEPGEYFKGAFIEIGAGFAAEKPIYVIGEPLPETSTFRSHPLWHQVETVSSAILKIARDFDAEFSLDMKPGIRAWLDAKPGAQV